MVSPSSLIDPFRPPAVAGSTGLVTAAAGAGAVSVEPVPPPQATELKTTRARKMRRNEVMSAEPKDNYHTPPAATILR